MGDRLPGTLGVSPWPTGPVSHLNSGATEFSLPFHPQTTWAHRDCSPGPLFSALLPTAHPDVAQLGVPAQPALAWARSEARPASSQGPWEQLAYSLGTRDTDFPGPLVMATAPPPKEWASPRDPELRPELGPHHKLAPQRLENLPAPGGPTSGGLPRCCDRTMRLISVSGWPLSWKHKRHQRAGSAPPDPQLRLLTPISGGKMAPTHPG